MKACSAHEQDVAGEELVRRRPSPAEGARRLGRDVSLDYVKRLIERDLERPSPKEWLARLERRSRIDLDPPPEDLIRQDRDSR